MKVLQINSVCGVGSTGRIATDLYKVIEEAGHECVIAYGRGTAPKGIKTIKIGTNFDNYIHVAKTRIFDKHGFGSIKATKEFIKKVEDYNPDVIHLHNIHGYYINIEILFDYLKRANKKVVWTLHDCWAFTGHCSHFDYIGCDKWENGCKECSQKKEYPTSLLKDNSQWNYSKKSEVFSGIKNMTIVTPSEWLANLVRKSFLAEYNVKVINNGIDLSIFKPTESKFREKYGLKNKIILLGVANVWTKKKGLDYFIKLAKNLDEKYKIVMVGITNKQKKSLHENIISIERTNDVKELAEIYSVADIFINPTLEDTFPTTNLEALACGTNVVTFNTGGSIECLNDKCGKVINKGNENELLNFIKNFDLNSVNSIECVNKAKLYDKRERYVEYTNIYKDSILEKTPK